MPFDPQNHHRRSIRLEGYDDARPGAYFVTITAWLRDESLEYSANLPAPDVLAAEIVEDLKSALAQFDGIAGELGEER